MLCKGGSHSNSRPRSCAWHVTAASLHPPAVWGGVCYCHPHFTHRVTQAQRGEDSCLRPPSGSALLFQVCGSPSRPGTPQSADVTAVSTQQGTGRVSWGTGAKSGGWEVLQRSRSQASQGPGSLDGLCQPQDGPLCTDTEAVSDRPRWQGPSQVGGRTRLSLQGRIPGKLYKHRGQGRGWARAGPTRIVQVRIPVPPLSGPAWVSQGLRVKRPPAPAMGNGSRKTARVTTGFSEAPHGRRKFGRVHGWLLGTGSSQLSSDSQGVAPAVGSKLC